MCIVIFNCQSSGAKLVQVQVVFPYFILFYFTKVGLVYSHQRVITPFWQETECYPSMTSTEVAG